MSGKISSLTKRRAMRKPDPIRWGFDSWTGSMARWLGYYERIMWDLAHPDPYGPMVARCPLCKRDGFELDPLANLWECKACGKAGNHWALESLLHPDESWDACADRADRIVAEAWKEGEAAERAAEQWAYQDALGNDGVRARDEGGEE